VDAVKEVVQDLEESAITKKGGQKTAIRRKKENCMRTLDHLSRKTRNKFPEKFYDTRKKLSEEDDGNSTMERARKRRKPIT
jgi:hypothetical protein